MTCLATPRHRVVDRSRIAFSINELLGHRTDPCCVFRDLVQQSKGLWARTTIRLVTQRYKTAGTSAGAAVFVPLECIFGINSDVLFSKSLPFVDAHEFQETHRMLIQAVWGSCGAVFPLCMRTVSGIYCGASY